MLVCIARERRTRLRDIAVRVGITERAAQSIVSDLVEAGYLTRHRMGTRNFYELHADQPLRDELAGDLSVGEWLRPILETAER